MAQNKGIQNGCARNEEDSKTRPVQSHEVFSSFFFFSYLCSVCVSFFFFSPTFPYRMASWWQEPEMREGVKTYSHRPLSPSSLSLSLTRFSRRFSPFSFDPSVMATARHLILSCPPSSISLITVWDKPMLVQITQDGRNRNSSSFLDSLFYFCSSLSWVGSGVNRNWREDVVVECGFSCE
jgi:hypothetical protein